MLAKDIMTKDVLSVNPQMSVKELADFFLQHKISGAPVMADSRLVGMVTEEDVIFHDKQVHLPTVVAIFDAVIYLDSPRNFEQEMGKVLGKKVESIMNTQVATVSEDTPVSEIATMMVKDNHYLIPVMSGDELLGIIGKADILKAITSEMEQ